MKKKTIFVTIILIFVFVFTPIFINKNRVNKVENKENVKKTKNESIKSDTKNKGKSNTKNDMAVFSSNTCFKKTYYIDKSNVNVYEKPDKESKVEYSLPKNSVIVAYREKNGYLYCEESTIGRKGWIKKNKDNLKGFLYKNTEYKVDVDLIKQKILVYKKDKKIRDIKCSTGILGDSDTETPLGMFYITNRGKYFYSNKYNQGGRYYIKFFANYLIHSIPVDKSGNIIEEEKNKLGFPASHGCIRVSVEDAKWLYNKIPNKSLIFIHY